MNSVSTHAKTLPSRPGWPELAVGVIAAIIAYLAMGILGALTPEDSPLSPGHVGFITSAVPPAIGVLAAALVRFRSLRPFGFRRTQPRWLLAGVLGGACCFVLSWPVSWIFDPLFPGSEAVQQSYRDATQLSLLSLAVTIFLGGVLTPIGEEMLFRGLITNFLFRWGPWVGVLVGSAIFAVAHGINSVMPLAFVVGIVASVLMRVSGSIWPAIAVHLIYNSGGLLYHGLTG